MSNKFLAPTLLQIFYEIILYIKVIVRSILDAITRSILETISRDALKHEYVKA